MKNKIVFLFIYIFLLSACADNHPVTLPFNTPDLPTKELTQMPIDKTPSKVTQTETTEIDAPDQNQADADVIYVRAVLEAGGFWTFYVTVAHPDTGWDDYADGWNVVLLDGTILNINPDDPFTRLLAHPHENEQPFTRSQKGILIPDGVTQVIVQAHDIVDGFGGQEILVNLDTVSGTGFEVEG